MPLQGYCASTPAERPGKGDEGWWAGRDDASMTEPTSSQENAQNAAHPTSRVHAVLGGSFADQQINCLPIPFCLEFAHQ